MATQNMNQVTLTGNLTVDPELRESSKGLAVVKCAIAVNQSFRDGSGEYKGEVSFFDLVIFGKTGEAFAKFHKKGNPVMVSGRIKQNSWLDENTGKNRSKVEVVVEKWFFNNLRNDEVAKPVAQPSASPAASPIDLDDDVPF